MEYGGPRMSRIAQGAMAVNRCMFPPVVGYSTEVSHGTVKTSSTTSFANLTVENRYEHIRTFALYIEGEWQ